MKSNEKNTLLCDLDGTLVDSAEDLALALNSLLSESGRSTLSLAEITSMVGGGAKKLVERGFFATGGILPKQENESVFKRFLKLYAAHLTDNTRPYPHVMETLQGLKDNGWRLAVCTNKPETMSRELLRRLHMLPLFDAVAGGDTYEVKKPDPGHLLQTLDSMGADRAGAVMLGDGKNDALAARAANLPVILVSFSAPREILDKLGADSVIASYRELPAALAKIVDKQTS